MKQLKAVKENLAFWRLNIYLIQRLLIAGSLFLLLFLLLTVDFPPGPSLITTLGKPSPVTIKAPHYIKAVDKRKTEKLKQAAKRRLKPLYKFELKNVEQAKNTVTQTFSQIEQVINEPLSLPEKVKKLDLLLPQVKAADKEWLAGQPPATVNALKVKTQTLLAQTMAEKIYRHNLSANREKVKRLATIDTDVHGARLIGAIAAKAVQPNMVIDKKGTSERLKKALAQIKPAVVQRLKGETIVNEGEIVKPQHKLLLDALGWQKNKVWASPLRLTGSLFIALGLIFLGAVYLREFQPKVFFNNKLLLLVAILLGSTAALAKWLTPLFSPYLIPTAAAAMLTTILLKPTAGIMMAITSSLTTGIIVNNPNYWMSSFLISLLAVYLTSYIKQRSDLTKAGLWLTLGASLTALAISLAQQDSAINMLLNMGWGALGGFAATVLTIGLLQFLEHAFNITTNLKLLELSNPMQPLLKELMLNAPGTYNHSIVAGNLAERAAELVGANPLLARVGAYYHDIGKIKRPFFFIENQRKENPHDKTQPNLSYLIIAAHVKEGVELAKSYSLPQEVVDIINQHHGTCLISYFYNRAKQRELKEIVSEEQFRYPGEKPRTKEAALVMLADAVEAAARSLPKPTHSRLELCIRRIIKERLRDGQLNESDLTLGDLEAITKVFSQMLTSIYHGRLEYPDLQLVKERKGLEAENIKQKFVQNNR